MNLSTKHLKISLLSGLLLTSTPAFAADDAAPEKKAPENKAAENRRDGGFFVLGAGYHYQNDPFRYDESADTGLTLLANIRYQWRGLYIEMPGGSSKNQTTLITLGYNVLNTERWSFDLHHSMNHRDLDYYYQRNGNEVLDQRISRSKPGVRITGSFDQRDVQFVIAKASGGDYSSNGLYASAWLTDRYQYFNWNFYLTLGLQYRSDKAVNYFYGVSEAQATNLLPQYQGDAGFEVTGQLGVDYPITRHWVFESYIRRTQLPSGITDSPFLEENHLSEAAVSVKYVF